MIAVKNFNKARFDLVYRGLVIKSCRLIRAGGRFEIRLPARIYFVVSEKARVRALILAELRAAGHIQLKGA